MPSPTPTIIYLFIFIFIFILFFENINIYLYILTQDIFHISQVFFQMFKISQSQFICSNYFHIHIYYIHISYENVYQYQNLCHGSIFYYNKTLTSFANHVEIIFMKS
jgi:hypothetical protein